MKIVDALNLNISDHANGYGKMDIKLFQIAGLSMIWPVLNWIRQIIFQKKYFLQSHG